MIEWVLIFWGSGESGGVFKYGLHFKNLPQVKNRFILIVESEEGGCYETFTRIITTPFYFWSYCSGLSIWVRYSSLGIWAHYSSDSLGNNKNH